MNDLWVMILDLSCTRRVPRISPLLRNQATIPQVFQVRVDSLEFEDVPTGGAPGFEVGQLKLDKQVRRLVPVLAARESTVTSGMHYSTTYGNVLLVLLLIANGARHKLLAHGTNQQHQRQARP